MVLKSTLEHLCVANGTSLYSYIRIIICTQSQQHYHNFRNTRFVFLHYGIRITIGSTLQRRYHNRKILAIQTRCPTHQVLIFMNGMGRQVKNTVMSRKNFLPHTSLRAPIKGADKNDRMPWKRRATLGLVTSLRGLRSHVLGSTRATWGHICNNWGHIVLALWLFGELKEKVLAMVLKNFKISFLGVATDRHGFGILTWKNVGTQKNFNSKAQN